MSDERYSGEGGYRYGKRKRKNKTSEAWKKLKKIRKALESEEDTNIGGYRSSKKDLKNREKRAELDHAKKADRGLTRAKAKYEREQFRKGEVSMGPFPMTEADERMAIRNKKLIESDKKEKKDLKKRRDRKFKSLKKLFTKK